MARKHRPYNGSNRDVLVATLLKRDRDIEANRLEMEARGREVTLLKKMFEDFGDLINSEEYKKRMQDVFDRFDERNKNRN